MVRIRLLRETSLLTDADVATCASALTVQITRDFAPAWYGMTAQVVAGGRPEAGDWLVHLQDRSDQAGALGYHDEKTGAPVGYVFVADDKRFGLSWTVTTSHEVLEMLLDPEVERVAQIPGRSPIFVAYEAADPVEADQLGYRIGNVLVSDFVLPAWFKPSMVGQPVDFGRHLRTPLSLAHGGYVSYWTPTTGWTQRQAETRPGAADISIRASRARRFAHFADATSRPSFAAALTEPGAVFRIDEASPAYPVRL